MGLSFTVGVSKIVDEHGAEEGHCHRYGRAYEIGRIENSPSMRCPAFGAERIKWSDEDLVCVLAKDAQKLQVINSTAEAVIRRWERVGQRLLAA